MGTDVMVRNKKVNSAYLVDRASQSSWVPPLLLGILSVATVILLALVGNVTMVLIGCVMTSLITAFVTLGPPGNQSEISPSLLIPTVVSAFQNVYLAPLATQMEATELQTIILWNVFYAIALLIALLMSGTKDAGDRVFRRSIMMITVIFIYGFVLAAIRGNDFSAAAASLRNIISPMLFLSLGILARARVNIYRYARGFVWLGALVIVVAFVEYTVPSFWQTMGLRDLWTLKGIRVQESTGLPLNFYASEQLIPGQYIRRMAGPFADPVNFGTYLFCLAVFSWFIRSKLILFASTLSALLTISKGALVGGLTFVAVWAKWNRSRFEFVLSSAIVVVFSLFFLSFSQTNSTGSTAAHIGGLLQAIIQLPSNPLGKGLGGTGVLSAVVSQSSEVNNSIVETGLGMVIGQLGIIGIAVYVVFFATILKMALRVTDGRVKILAMTLCLAFLLNSAFNEVALSPNSSAPFFFMIGLVTSLSKSDRKGALDRIPADQPACPGTIGQSIRMSQAQEGKGVSN